MLFAQGKLYGKYPIGSYYQSHWGSRKLNLINYAVCPTFITAGIQYHTLTVHSLFQETEDNIIKEK